MALPPKLYMWQRQKLYPNSGKMLDTGNNEVDVAEIVSRLSAGTAISSGIRVYSNVAQGGQGRSSSGEDMDLPDLIIPRGSIVTLAARAIPSGTTTVDAVLVVKEEF